MTVEQWTSLSKDTREALITSVFNNEYLALTRAEANPEHDQVIKEVLRSTQLNGDTAYINIHKEVKIK